MLNINDALKAIGLGLLVLFFAVGVVKTCSSVADLKRPEHAIKLFIRFALAKAAVTYGLDLMLAVFRIVQGMVSTIITQSGLSGSTGTTLPQEIIDKINDVGFWDSIPLWAAVSYTHLPQAVGVGGKEFCAVRLCGIKGSEENPW